MGTDINTNGDSEDTLLPEGWLDDPYRSFDDVRHSLMETLPRPGGTATIQDIGQHTPQSDDCPFELQSFLGSGGFGDVWSAQQAELGRTVAVKRIRPDLTQGADPNAREVLLAHFRAEALITARLEHPNIVPVHELRTDRNRMPHLAMKLVHGMAWSDRLLDDFDRLAPEVFLSRNLPILVQVCHAVGYAHERGVVHRDLKPSQVMLGAHGEVLLMDWGLAFLYSVPPGPSESSPPIPRTLPTMSSITNPSGTPAYMAPEQTHRTVDRLGPWTDVYLLGGMLYELLTGAAPHRATTAREAFESAQRGILIPPRERTPGRPIPADLEALCKRAMAPQPEDRLPSVALFLEGLSDHLTGATRRLESIALAQDVVTRMGTAKQDYHKLASMTSELNRALVLWPGNTGAAQALEQVHQQFSQAALAQGDLGLARIEAERVQTPHARQDLERAIGARQLILRNRGRQRSLALAGCAVLAAALTFTGYTYVQDQAIARRQVLAANSQLQQQARLSNEARADAEELLSFMLGDLRLHLEPMGQLPLLSEVGEKARRYFDRKDPSGLTSLALIHKTTTLAQVASVLQAQGNSEQANQAARLALDTILPVAAAETKNGSMQFALAEAWNSLGQVQYATGQMPDAADSLNQAISACRRALEADPDRTAWRGFLAETADRAGNVLMSQGKLGPAEDRFRESLEILAQLRKVQPEEPEWMQAEGQVLGQLGYAYRLQGRLPDARETLVQAAQTFGKAVELVPSNILWRSELATLQDRLGGVLLASGDWQGALAAYEANITLLRGLTTHDPTNVGWTLRLAVALNRIGTIQEQTGRFHDALARFEQSLELARSASQRDPLNTSALSNQAWTLGLIGKIAADQNQFDKAEKHYTVSEELRKNLAQRDPSNRWWQSDLAQALAQRAELELRRNAPNAARSALQNALEIWRSLLTKDPANQFWRNGAARALWAHSRANALSGEVPAEPGQPALPRPEDLLTEALALVLPLATESQDSTHLATLALVLRDLGRRDETTTLVQTLRERGYREFWLENREVSN